MNGVKIKACYCSDPIKCLVTIVTCPAQQSLIVKMDRRGRWIKKGSSRLEREILCVLPCHHSEITGHIRQLVNWRKHSQKNSDGYRWMSCWQVQCMRSNASRHKQACFLIHITFRSTKPITEGRCSRVNLSLCACLVPLVAAEPWDAVIP